ncbi:MAG: hypothetical protein ABIJ48_09625 [Actinomycetota bacterium]
MRASRLLRRISTLVTAGAMCSGLLGCVPPERLFTLRMVNPCGFPVEVKVWSVSRDGVPEAVAPPDDVWTIGARDSLTVQGPPDEPHVVRMDQLGFRQELIPPPGGELSDVILTPDAASCERVSN